MNDATHAMDSSDVVLSSQVRPLITRLREVKYVQNVGRFEKAQSVSGAAFGPCTLLFGENGWGKSTLADLLRSLTTNSPDILLGRKTLAGGPNQKAVVHFGDHQRAVFEGGAWSGVRPSIAVYDSVFVNDNVYSGDVVTNEHLKKQYGMVVGAEGVRRVRRLIALRDINEYSRREHHAEVEDDPSGESSDEELKGFCRRVLDLTRGM